MLACTGFTVHELRKHSTLTVGNEISQNEAIWQGSHQIKKINAFKVRNGKRDSLKRAQGQFETTPYMCYTIKLLAIYLYQLTDQHMY